ncbi:ATP-binding protein [Streptomyces phaeochromogenes]|uniref:ATP-binding protein n=1 Tax=Streptomyces phaeochromogenes TaxID=1923 RepID=UPI002E2D48B0|nr:ATP-binding protein [Streptomyces phaeochromogenes]
MPELSEDGDWGLLLGISAAEFAARSFSADSSGLQHARRFARNVLDEWGLTPYIDDAVIVVGELIANAARHALEPDSRGETAGTAWLGLVRRQHAVICAVADPSPCAPTRQHLGQLSESGRGLQIIEALTSSWGCSQPQRSGKLVWARVSTPPQP